MNLLTIIVCAYLALAALNGLRKGVIRSFISILFLVAVVVLTLLLTPLVSKVVGGSTYIREFYTKSAEHFLSAYVTSSGKVDLSSLNAGGGSLSSSPFQAAAAVLSILLSASGAPELTTQKLVGFLIGLTATAITFVIVFVILLIVRIMVGRAFKNSTVSALDHALGFPLGLAKGLVVVWVVLGVINLLAFVPQINPIAMQIPPSPILSWLNQNNLIVKGITMLIRHMLGA